jgi:hypothetical protein
MMRLAEYRSKSSLLADFLPWAALVAEGVEAAVSTGLGEMEGRLSDKYP